MGQNKRGLEKQPESPPIAFPSAFGSEPNAPNDLTWWSANTATLTLIFCILMILPGGTCQSRTALSSLGAETQAEPPPQCKCFKRGTKASFPQDAPPPTEDSACDVKAASEWPTCCIPVCLCCNLPFQLLLVFYKLSPKLSCLKQPFCYAYQIQLVRNLGSAH